MASSDWLPIAPPAIRSFENVWKCFMGHSKDFNIKFLVIEPQDQCCFSMCHYKSSPQGTVSTVCNNDEYWLCAISNNFYNPIVSTGRVSFFIHHDNIMTWKYWMQLSHIDHFTRACITELQYFLCCWHAGGVEHIIKLLVIWAGMVPMWCHCNVEYDSHCGSSTTEWSLIIWSLLSKIFNNRHTHNSLYICLYFANNIIITVTNKW